MKLSLLTEITERKTIFSFSDKPVEEEKIKLLFEAARWAPSSSNIQPWRFIYATKDDVKYYPLLFDLINEGNKRWAFTAPLLALSLAEKVTEKTLKNNRYAFHDLGMAFGLLLMQATHMGLFVHPLGGYNVEKSREALKIPERFEPGAMFAIGYKGKPDNLPPDLQSREENRKRERKDIEEIVFKGSWNVRI